MRDGVLAVVVGVDPCNHFNISIFPISKFSIFSDTRNDNLTFRDIPHKGAERDHGEFKQTGRLGTRSARAGPSFGCATTRGVRGYVFVFILTSCSVAADTSNHGFELGA